MPLRESHIYSLQVLVSKNNREVHFVVKLKLAVNPLIFILTASMKSSKLWLDAISQNAWDTGTYRQHWVSLAQN